MVTDQFSKELFQHISDGVAVYEAVDNGSDFVFKDLNPSGEKLSKIKKEEVLGKKLTEVFPGAKEYGLLDALKKTWETGEETIVPLSEYKDDRLVQTVENHIFKLDTGEVVALYKDITEQKNLKEDYERIFNNFPDLYFHTDLEANITLVSPSSKEITGYTQEELIGKNAGDFHPDSKDRDRFIAAVKESASVKDYRLDFIKKSGDIMPAILNAHLLFDNNHKPIGIEGVIRDITNQAKSEEAIRKSREDLKLTKDRFEAIVRSVSDFIWETDADGKYVFVSGRTMDILGYEPEEIIGKTPFDFMTPEEAKRVGGIFKALASEKKPVVDVENWNMKKDGSKVLFLTNGLPILDDKGDLIGYRGVDKDITKIKQSETKLQQIIDTSQDVFYMHDSNNIMTYVSPQCIKMFGYTPEEMKANWQDFLTDNPINQKAIEITETSVKTGERQSPYFLEFKRKDGTNFIVQAVESPVKDQYGKVIGLAGTIRDVSKEKKAEATLQEKIAELEKMNKLMVGRELRMAELKEEIKKNKQTSDGN